MPSRRSWKSIFRRVRLYLPLVVLLLGAMALFLPINSGWVARWAEDQAATGVGVNLSIGAMELIVADAVVEARDVSVRAPGAPPDAPEFRLQRILADGDLGGILSGGDRWPQQLIASVDSPLRLEKNSAGAYELNGAARALRDTLAALTQRPPASPINTTAGGSGRTPLITVRNLRLAIEEPVDWLPSLAIKVDSARLDERSSATAPWRATATGVAIAQTTEEFNLSLVYFPDQQRLSLRGFLSGGVVPFFIPSLGDFSGQARRLQVRAEAELEEDGTYSAAVSITAERFEVRRARLGGERWSDAPLDIRIQATFNPQTQRLRVAEVSLSGQQIDIGLEGAVTLRGDYPGEASLAVNRLPPGALALGRNELLDRLGVDVTATATSPTLRLEARATGDFAHPADLESRLSARLAGWRFNAPELPNPIELRNLQVEASPQRLDLRNLTVELGGLDLSASAALPINDSLDGGTSGTLHLEARGRPEAAFLLLQRLGAIPPELVNVTAPIRLEAQIAVTAAAADGGPPLTFSISRPESRLDLAWEEGLLELRRLLEPVNLRPGRMLYKNEELRFPQLAVELGGLQVTVQGTARGGPLSRADAPLSYEAEVSAAGPLANLVTLIGREVAIPPPIREIQGDFSLLLQGSGTSDAPEAPDYNLRLALDGVSGVIATPHRPVPVRDLAMTLIANPWQVRIQGASLTAVDEELGDSRIELSATIDGQAIEANADIRTTLEFFSSVLLKDLKDLYLAGPVAADARASLRPTQPLPPAPDVLRRWIALLARPGIRVHPDPAKADIVADWFIENKQEAPVEVTPRDFPVRLTNVRGAATFSPEGIMVRAARAQVGSAEEVRVPKLRVELGRPTRLTFEAEIPSLDINEWLDGWGKRPWSAKPYANEPSWAALEESVPIFFAQGDIKLGDAKFLQFEGGQLAGQLRFEAWSRQPGRLAINEMTIGRVYDGSAAGDLFFEFPAGERPILNATADLEKINLDGFMDALLERDQTMDGFLDGSLQFNGQLLNYPTYEGTGRYDVSQSSFGGRMIPDYARGLIEWTSGEVGNDTDIVGTASMAGQRVTFPDLVLVSPQVTATAEGFVDFAGNLSFDLTVSLISANIKNLPIIGRLSDVVSFLGRRIISYRLEGTVKEPDPRAVPTLMQQLDRVRGLLEQQEGD